MARYSLAGEVCDTWLGRVLRVRLAITRIGRVLRMRFAITWLGRVLRVRFRITWLGCTQGQQQICHHCWGKLSEQGQQVCTLYTYCSGPVEIYSVCFHLFYDTIKGELSHHSVSSLQVPCLRRQNYFGMD